MSLLSHTTDVDPQNKEECKAIMARYLGPKCKLSRREVFARDKFTCQYCGVKGLTLTLDHVVPKHKGGPHLWENITSACIRCNHKKAGMTPVEAGMKLLSEPKAPRPNPYYIFRYYNILEEWEKFIPWSQGN